MFVQKQHILTTMTGSKNLMQSEITYKYSFWVDIFSLENVPK